MIKGAIEKHGNTPHAFVMPVWEAKKATFVDDFARRLRYAIGRV